MFAQASSLGVLQEMSGFKGGRGSRALMRSQTFPEITLPPLVVNLNGIVRTALVDSGWLMSNALNPHCQKAKNVSPH